MDMENPDTIRKAWLVYSDGGGAVKEVEFRRAENGPYAAQIVDPAGLTVGYSIELELVDGRRVPGFASREAMHEVQVQETEEVLQEKASLGQVGGRRSVVSSSFEYVHFGSVTTEVMNEAGTLERRAISDRYYRIEAGYTYRALGTIAEFGIRGGVVRGRAVVPGQTDPAKFDVGLNYGAPTIRLRALEGLHLEGTLLTSVTEVGFSTGGGAAVLLGNPYGNRLTVGFESIQTFGTRFYSRLDLRVGGVSIAPIVEITDMPHADRYGVRLLTELTLPLYEGLQASARLGYQARDADSGGLSAGLTLSHAFLSPRALSWASTCGIRGHSRGAHGSHFTQGLPAARCARSCMVKVSADAARCRARGDRHAARRRACCTACRGATWGSGARALRGGGDHRGAKRVAVPGGLGLQPEAGGAGAGSPGQRCGSAAAGARDPADEQGRGRPRGAGFSARF
jgi:hypothetical protein